MTTPILIDTDMAIDDWLAILYLLRHPQADVRAITVAATGEAHARPGERNARRLLALARHPSIPTRAGSPFPLVGRRVFPLIIRLMMDACLFLRLPAPLKAVSTGQNALDVIVQTLQACADPVTIVALGPLTNLAQALQQQPQLAEKIGGIFIMGGALQVPGNLASVNPALRANTHAEWNIYIDPQAANIVFGCGAPVTLVPLDATNQVPLTAGLLAKLAGQARHPAAKFSHQALARIFRLSNGREFYFWDPLAAAAALQPELLQLETRLVRVIEDDGSECGRVIESPAGYPIHVAFGADAQAFERVYLEILGRDD